MKINKTYTEEEEIDEPENETDTTAAEEAKSEEGKNTLVEVIIKGICDYFGINYDRDEE